MNEGVNERDLYLYFPFVPAELYLYTIILILLAKAGRYIYYSDIYSTRNFMAGPRRRHYDPSKFQ